MASPIAPPSVKSFHSSSLKTECRMSSKSAGGSAAMRSRSVSSRRSACVGSRGGLLPTVGPLLALALARTLALALARALALALALAEP